MTKGFSYGLIRSYRGTCVPHKYTMLDAVFQERQQTEKRKETMWKISTVKAYAAVEKGKANAIFLETAMY